MRCSCTATKSRKPRQRPIIAIYDGHVLAAEWERTLVIRLTPCGDRAVKV